MQRSAKRDHRARSTRVRPTRRAGPLLKRVEAPIQPSIPQAYKGALFYSSGQLDASRFVIREGAIAFDVTDVFEGETWQVSGIAPLREDGSYSATRLVAYQAVANKRLLEQESVPLSIRFVLGAITPISVEVSGTFFVEADAYDFRGVLGRFTAPKRQATSKPKRRG